MSSDLAWKVRIPNGQLTESTNDAGVCLGISLPREGYDALGRIEGGEIGEGNSHAVLLYAKVIFGSL